MNNKEEKRRGPNKICNLATLQLYIKLWVKPCLHRYYMNECRWNKKNLNCLVISQDYYYTIIKLVNTLNVYYIII